MTEQPAEVSATRTARLLAALEAAFDGLQPVLRLTRAAITADRVVAAAAIGDAAGQTVSAVSDGQSAAAPGDGAAITVERPVLTALGSARLTLTAHPAPGRPISAPAGADLAAAGALIEAQIHAAITEAEAATDRARLIEALTLTNAGGFVLYDEEDHILCSGAGDTALYPAHVALFAPGRHIRAAHEDIATNHLNLSPEEQKRWVAERTKHSPATPYYQHRVTTDQRHAIVYDSYTSGGARVTSLLEVTELHQKAADLNDALQTVEQQNSALERQAAALRRANEEIKRQALQDALTGLANRRHLESELAIRAAQAADANSDLAVLHVDLDWFKQINDTKGHAAGDFVLRHVAEVLRQETNDGDFIARNGGDEFVILTDGAARVPSIEALAERIAERMSRPIPFEDGVCQSGASIGAKVSEPHELSSPALLLASADMALYAAKAMGRGRYVRFSAEMADRVRAQKSLTSDLLRPATFDEFTPMYQPLIDARTGRISGVEALARWRHPVQGVLAPGQFFPLAEQLGVEHKIDQAIARRAMADLAAWDAAGLHIPKVSINASNRLLHDPQAIQELFGAAAQPHRFSVEVLESTFSDQLDDRARHVIDYLKDLGVGIDIDDFGMGHASLMGLLIVGPRRLKISREFVSPLPASEQHASLVRFIVDIARSLDIEIVAEGVETEAQRAFLTSAGCDVLQGYYFGKPMPADALAEHIAGASWAAAG